MITTNFQLREQSHGDDFIESSGAAEQVLDGVDFKFLLGAVCRWFEQRVSLGDLLYHREPIAEFSHRDVMMNTVQSVGKDIIPVTKKPSFCVCTVE